MHCLTSPKTFKLYIQWLLNIHILRKIMKKWCEALSSGIWGGAARRVEIVVLQSFLEIIDFSLCFHNFIVNMLKQYEQEGRQKFKWVCFIQICVLLGVSN